MNTTADYLFIGIMAFCLITLAIILFIAIKATTNKEKKVVDDPIRNLFKKEPLTCVRGSF